MRKHQGFILLSVLLTLTLLCVLILSQLQLIVLQMKLFNQHHDQQLVFHEMEEELKHLIASSTSLTATHYSLTLNGRGYSVDITEAGFFPCLPIGKNSSQHWLVHLQAMGEKKASLEVRYAEPARFKPCQQGNARPIQAGVQSWLYQRYPYYKNSGRLVVI